MNKKIFKISFILILAFVFCGSYVYATNIDLNLPGITSENNEQMTNNVETVNNEQTANNVENSIENTNNTFVISNFFSISYFSHFYLCTHIFK